MITTPARYAPPWPAIAGFLVGTAGIVGSITVVFLGMRSVLDDRRGVRRGAWLLVLAALAIVLGIVAGAWVYAAAAGG